jgi:pilus assembly protein Flp/PilA
MSVERESLSDCLLPSFPEGFEFGPQAKGIAPTFRGTALIGDIIMVDRVTEVSERIRGVLAQLNAQEEGQGMVEYGLILVLISIVVIVILTTLGHTVNNVFSNISHGLSS